MKVYLDTLGCRLNQSEIESMARQFRAAGHEIVASAAAAELAVVNTCAVTNDAASDSRRKIRQLSQAGVHEIIATGCWSTLKPKEASALPNVLKIVPNDRKDSLVTEIFNDHPSSFIPHPSTFDLEPLARSPLPGLHRRTRAFIKAQDGCDNHCTFCITTVARGASRSRSLADVINDIQFALAGGAKEIVLTGVHLGSWGYDFGSHLRDLVKTILRETDTPRLRLSSLEPWDLDAGFFSLWQDKRLCPHFHLPLQSGCKATLKRMARKTTPASFRGLAAAARQVVPDAAITTDLIAGFPGETESEFAESLDFVREMNFAGGHAFTYSPRPGTAATRLAGQIRPEVRKERNAALREVLEESAKSYRQKFIGQTLSVLWESSTQLTDQGWQMEGWSENYLRVETTAPHPLWNEISTVRLIAMDRDVISGVLTF
ncbi:MAG: tRNA (N(6)-L-threonylcarbamoyladenosine(37)-C(2))-methylthiotransferase MtaB [Chloroflexi bacterium]|nr:tRNA (N(6)-L-threonylcarbamoyladenosine(37)-C(2))-methylthiotransferase MtaB [Chloroflexota bacterium]MBI3338762.1 tRNA (N(6)-L-threonylcarbamoyladenosine(37)-C(2))-methylthiotransferase MtaB [Chloroflexota bacterium]